MFNRDFTRDFRTQIDLRVAVAGQVGLPSSGMSAIQVTLTAVDPTSQGGVRIAPDGISASITNAPSALVYGSGSNPGTTSGTLKIDVANLHGDIVASIAPTATTVTGYSEATEFGQPRDSAGAADDYGWLGTKQRSTDDFAGLTLMGTRLYEPRIGRFLSRDPLTGGNDNSYAYPADPINEFDVNGNWCIGSLGTTCTRYITGPNGRPLPVRADIRKKITKKHNISWNTLKLIVPDAYYLFTNPQNGRLQYLVRLYKTRRDKNGVVHETGDEVSIRLSIDYDKSRRDGKTFGLVTAYCKVIRSPGHYTTHGECPDWVNKNPLGPPAN